MTDAKPPASRPPPASAEPATLRDPLWAFRPPAAGERVNEHIREEAPGPALDVRRLARLVRRDGRGPAE